MVSLPDRTWIVRLDEAGQGPRLAVKDAIDVAGVPTTMGCAAIADVAEPAAADAGCVATARAAGARVVGKANLHELCYGVTGINPWYGTPVNPLAPGLVPGGSSSGSAVAVATEEADVGFGTDTGGSVRIPAACCGIVGLKTTWGRISLDGVGALAPTLDTVGPLALDMAGVVAGMRLLEPGFGPAGTVTAVGRVRRPGADPALEQLVDRVLADWEVDVVDVELPGWVMADHAFEVLIGLEAYTADRHLLERSPDRVGALVSRRVLDGAALGSGDRGKALRARLAWQHELDRVFDRVQVLALPTLGVAVPEVDDGTSRPPLNQLTRTVNLAGTPALALPLGGPGESLQLVGPWNGEELLCAAGLAAEQAVAAG